MSEQDDDTLIVRDSNGTVLADGDAVTLIKDLKVKGTSVTLKRGTLVKNIRLTDDADEMACNAEKVKGWVLRTEFVKKACSSREAASGVAWPGSCAVRQLLATPESRWRWPM